MKIGSDTINGVSFDSTSARLAILIEATLTRGRTILFTTLVSTSTKYGAERFYGTVIWREGE